MTRTDPLIDDAEVGADPATVDYLPVDPRGYRPGIGLIGCGNISRKHLAAYARAGYRVLALCDLDFRLAEARRADFFPDAQTLTDYRELLARADIEIVDIATHVDVRPRLVADALRAGKHVLSQKPFVRDLDEGERLIALAAEQGRVLAVNQNGRWAPHFAYLLSAARQGLLGRISTADFAVYWPHDLDVQADPVFSRMEDLILYDFGIHWFDVVAQLFAEHGQAHSVFASVSRRADQVIPVPTQAQVVIGYENASATLLLRGSSRLVEEGSYRVDGTDGVLVHRGLSLGGDEVRLVTSASDRVETLTGDWWDNGMHGAMSELMRAIEEGREPTNRASESLPGLALCFAAIASSRSGAPVDPRSVRTLPR